MSAYSRQELRRAWRQVLGVDHTDPDQNFFELGGDSLAVLEFISVVSEAAQVEIPIDVVFSDGTLGGIERAVGLDP